jgi:beta-glucosidase
MVNCQEHKNIALEVAEKSICLLKNQNDLLPLKKSIKNIAVIGPSAAKCRFGGYSSASSVDRAITLLDGIQAIVSKDTEVTFHSGCSILDADISYMEEAIRITKKAEVAIVAVGDSEETCGENFDRADLNLPGKQLDLVKAIHATGTPVILVLQNGRPLSITWENENIPAIIEAWHVGEQGGMAIAKVLFGDVNPAGRLPISFPKSVGQIPVHYNRCPFSAIKYVEMDWLPLYPFGYGLSYTNFEYSNIRLSKSEIRADETVDVMFDVTNIGNCGGEEVAQLYIHDEYSSVLRPYKELAGFKRIHLDKGETKTVTLTIGYEQLRVMNKDFKWGVEEGKFEVMVGNNSANILLTEEFNILPGV